MLILDLDDTIFETKSMDSRIFNPAISILKEYYSTVNSDSELEEIVATLWSKPIDVVFLKYPVPETIVSDFFKEIEKIDSQKLNIIPFDDYKELIALPFRKVLVTTGIKELQMAKIKALGIEADFDFIYIDDPRLNPRQHKADIFKQLLNETNISPKDIWVIGDNPTSELKAGFELDFNTIQMAKFGQEKSEYAHYCISSFQELIPILK